jgi:alginate O-acetyltransferase complex protein AlgI
VVFSSHLFLFGFLPLALAVYFAAPRRARNLVVVLTSCVFYGWSHPAYLLLLLTQTGIDYWAGLVQATESWWPVGKPLRPLAPGGPRSRIQRTALVASIVSNLGLLAFFKYFHFGLDSWNALAVALGLDAARVETALRVALPLGISFYTFEAMSYSIDVWRGRARPMRSFVDFACFVWMWPQLVAGPIVRFTEIADQLVDRRDTLARFARGVSFFAVGLAKKVMLANPCGKVADTVFDAAASGVLDTWYGLAAYAFQIYFDFSGYSDMAIGLGLMLGFVFPKNFDAPYRARSITEFWRRWHLSLSTWLRDYLYVPLGGNRRGESRTYANLMIVMLLGGLWHGASWNFVLWGAMHGALLTIERAVGPERLWGRLPDWARVAGTFFVVLLTWVPFRAADFAASADFYARLFGLAPAADAAGLLEGLIGAPYLLGSTLLAAAIVWTCPQTWTWTRVLGWGKTATTFALFGLAVAALATQDFNPFLYFLF